MKEQNTNYAFKLKYLENPTFDKVRDLAAQFVYELPRQLQNELYEALNRGVDILDSEPQMVTYLYSFGKMHQAKLQYAFDKLPSDFLQQDEINIIDYGCGQALGTMCYADFLHKNGYSQKVKNITLIEPSEMCLKRATLHVSVFFPNAEIKTVCKTFDDLDADNICCDEDTPTLHILSNVLDILDFDLNSFSNLLNECLNGYNQFVCVGPYYGYSENDIRMEELCTKLHGTTSFYKNLNKYELQADKTWTARILCFSVGEFKEVLSTEVTYEDWNNAFEDDYGVFYSKDGKRLIGYQDISNEYEYKVKEGTKVICDYAFSDHDDYASFLKKIILPDSILMIGKFAFACSTLESLNIPKKVSYIGSGCLQAEGIHRAHVNVSCDSPYFEVHNHTLYTKGREKLHSYFGNSSHIEIPSEVKNIYESAFFACHSLQSITIPNSVKSIGDGAFMYCSSIHKIALPNSISNIGNETFYGCKELQEITLSDSITSIGNEAFMYCLSLRNITIPNSVKSIGEKAFWGCNSLQQVILPKSLEDKYIESTKSDDDFDIAMLEMWKSI